jgi:hypothetical protein
MYRMYVLTHEDERLEPVIQLDDCGYEGLELESSVVEVQGYEWPEPWERLLCAYWEDLASRSADTDVSLNTLLQEDFCCVSALEITRKWKPIGEGLRRGRNKIKHLIQRALSDALSKYVSESDVERLVAVFEESLRPQVCTVEMGGQIFQQMLYPASSVLVDDLIDRMIDVYEVNQSLIAVNKRAREAAESSGASR